MTGGGWAAGKSGEGENRGGFLHRPGQGQHHPHRVQGRSHLSTNQWPVGCYCSFAHVLCGSISNISAQCDSGSRSDKKNYLKFNVAAYYHSFTFAKFPDSNSFGSDPCIILSDVDYFFFKSWIRQKIYNLKYIVFFQTSSASDRVYILHRKSYPPPLFEIIFFPLGGFNLRCSFI